MWSSNNIDAAQSCCVELRLEKGQDDWASAAHFISCLNDSGIRHVVVHLGADQYRVQSIVSPHLPTPPVMPDRGPAGFDRAQALALVATSTTCKSDSQAISTKGRSRASNATRAAFEHALLRPESQLRQRKPSQKLVKEWLMSQQRLLREAPISSMLVREANSSDPDAKTAESQSPPAAE